MYVIFQFRMLVRRLDIIIVVKLALSKAIAVCAAYAVSRRPVTAEAQIRSQVSLWCVWCGQTASETGFPVSTCTHSWELEAFDAPYSTLFLKYYENSALLWEAFCRSWCFKIFHVSELWKRIKIEVRYLILDARICVGIKQWRQF